MQTATELKEL